MEHKKQQIRYRVLETDGLYQVPTSKEQGKDEKRALVQEGFRGPDILNR